MNRCIGRGSIDLGDDRILKSTFSKKIIYCGYRVSKKIFIKELKENNHLKREILTKMLYVSKIYV